MDVNYILAREQMELALARASLHAGARAAHQGLANQYRDMVESHRRDAHAKADLRADRSNAA
jgi:hypothetical protein